MNWQRTHWRVTLAAVMLLGVAGAGALFAVTAHADDFPGNYNETLVEDANMTYCLADFTTDAGIAHYAMDVLSSTTDMTDQFYSSCSGSVWPNVWWWEDDLAAGGRGHYECWFYWLGECTSSDAVLDLVEIDNGDWDWEDRRKTAVHELGHAAGLNDHYFVDHAMLIGGIPNTLIKYCRYSTHDIAHIDLAY